jgi:voltage-gated potassium channel
MSQIAWRRYSEWPLAAAALIFLVAYSIEVIENVPDSRSAVFDWIIWITWAFFIADFIANLVLAERRLNWFVRNLHEVVILALPVLRPLRLLRLLALLRLMQRVAGHTLRGRVVIYVIGSATLLTYVGALSVLDAEQNVPGSNIHNFGDALWWAFVTIATVGYGDHYPITFLGRVVAVGLMIGGVAVLGLVTATLASWLVEQVGNRTAQITEEVDASAQAQLLRMSQQIDRLTSIIESMEHAERTNGTN